jgi:hypothetical protein
MHQNGYVGTREASFATKRPRVRTSAAAAYIGCSPSKLNKSRLDGSGPPFYRVGSCIVYDLDEIDSWLLMRRCFSTSEADEALDDVNRTRKCTRRGGLTGTSTPRAGGVKPATFPKERDSGLGQQD